MQVINIKSSIRDYDVHICESMGFLDSFKNIAERFYIIDSNVWNIYGSQTFPDATESNRLILPIDEERKNLQTVMDVYDALMAKSAKRNMTVISIGGGILQDISGFATSTLYRGLNWIFVPTTLLAQADSCIGSKTSLNYKRYKNLVGTFFPPNRIYLNTSFLKTLREEDFFSGMGEVVKLHLMGGAQRIAVLERMLPALLERDEAALLEAVKNSLEVKLSYMQDDEFDTGRRNLLNFGHCFGHALESTSNFAIPHGQAVLIGIVLANIVAKARGLLTEDSFRRFYEKLLRPAINSIPEPAQLDPEKIYAAMKMDKKRVGEGLVLVMMTEGAKMTKVDNFDIKELAEAATELKRHLALV